MTVLESFRKEVTDKFSVVFNGCHSLPLTRVVNLLECEDFIVDLYKQDMRAAQQEALEQVREHLQRTHTDVEIDSLLKGFTLRPVV